MQKQKLLEQATRKVKEAESKAQDLSINIQYVRIPYSFINQMNF